MREILFRGKRKDNGEWVYGGFYGQDSADGASTYYILHHDKLIAVDPKTVGQYTGFTDRNKVRIFEGDIIHILSNMDEEGIFEVIFDHGGWFLDPNGGDDPLELYIQADHLKKYRIIKVIGNVFDTPELLGRE